MPTKSTCTGRTVKSVKKLEGDLQTPSHAIRKKTSAKSRAKARVPIQTDDGDLESSPEGIKELFTGNQSE